MEPSKNTFDPSTGHTCMTCRLVFATSEIQREHYQSEWHRYNVKRQVASLPPISLGDFEGKVQQFRETTAAPVQDTGKPYCQFCRKQFTSKNAYENHLNSKKHKENELSFVPRIEDQKEDTALTTVEKKPSAKPVEVIQDDMSDDDSSSGWRTVHSDDEDDEDDEFEYDESKAIPDTSCLFCQKASPNVEQNVMHMSVTHGFFIPDADYCCDVPGLLKYLGIKAGCGYVCIRCNERSKRFHNLESCQKHMRDKQHCFISLEGDDVLEYLDFYDYGDLVTDENDTDASDVCVDAGDHLVLPSGAKIGHRSLLRYYRQSLKPLDHPMTRPRPKSGSVFSLMGGHYKALGWTGTTGQASVQRARDFKVLKKVVDKYRLKQGMGANKLFKTKGRKDQM